MRSTARPSRRVSRTASAIALALGASPAATGALAAEQPALEARVKPIVEVDGLRFRDLDGDGALTPYEDWRLDPADRAADLVGRMTGVEKAGLMLIDTLNASCDGAVPIRAFDYVNTQKMRRFIFRNVVTPEPTCGPDTGFRAGSSLTPEQAAGYTNSVQELAESARLGIPALFKSNARNHYEKSAREGINTTSGAFTEFPKEAGLASASLGAGDMSVVETFSAVMGAEWRAIGLRGMYGYMADLSTEPRWYRVHETFTENADLASDILRTLVEKLQGGPLSPDSNVALTVKHFPGGGPQAAGFDPHYSFGKDQVYPSGAFGEHMKPFQAAIDAGAAAIMPYYGRPIGVTVDGVALDEVGMAFSEQVVTGLLRDKLGFKGYVNSDTGIITDRAWGLEDKSVAERVAAAINGGTDTLSGFDENQVVTDLVAQGLVSEARVDEAARRLLEPMFAMGLFENPYVDASQAGSVIGSDANRAAGLAAQRGSVVLLENGEEGAPLLPLKAGARVYALGLDADAVSAHGFEVTDGRPGEGASRPSAEGHDYAVIRVTVTNPREVTGTYRSDDPATGMNPEHLHPLTGKPFGADDACVARDEPECTDDGLIFGGSLPWEGDDISFSAMAAADSWAVSPPLADIQAVMAEVGADKTVLDVYFRQPYVLDAESGLRDAGAIVATFGVGDAALMDVLGGKVLTTGEAVAPGGKLPFALAANPEAIVENAPDAPGYPEADTLYPFGFGLTY